MALKKLSTHKNTAKSLRKAQGKKIIKKKIKKIVKKSAKKTAKKLSTHKNPAKSLRKAQGKSSTRKSKASTRKSKASTRKSPAKTKKLTKKLIKKTTKKIVKKSLKSEGNLIGLITHYFPHVQAAVIKLKAPLSIGETIKIKGHTTDLTQAVTSMQMDRVTINNAKKGMEIGVQVSARVRHGDKVYKS
ncbi:MAG: hypothetical protein WC543_05310 [Candidatus Omnitrophota bacterium]